jgi:hypothetical protein
MRNHVGVGLLLIAITGLTHPGQTGDSAAVAQLIRLDHEWTDAEIRNDVAVIGRVLAEDFISVSPVGSVADKQQFLRDYSSGDLKIASEQLSDYRVRLYGKTAVMTHLATLTGTYKGRDISGENRSFHVWVRQGARWEMVANQGTSVVR